MKITACIFDLDGVIVDTARFHYIAWKELANSLGFDFSKKDNERLKGVSRMRSLDILLEIGNINFNRQKKLELATKKNDRYVELISSLTSDDILPGVLNFITDLKSKKYKIALGSASKNAMTILKSINLINVFDTIIDGKQVTKAKPNPEVFLLGAKQIAANPSECIVFEDAQAGIDAAKNAKMFVIGIGNKNNLHNANFVVDDFREAKIEKFIKRLSNP